MKALGASSDRDDPGSLETTRVLIVPFSRTGKTGSSLGRVLGTINLPEYRRSAIMMSWVTQTIRPGACCGERRSAQG